MLVVGHQEGHPAHRKSVPITPKDFLYGDTAQPEVTRE